MTVVELVKTDAEQEPITFDDFWILYPYKVAKKDARRAWAKINPSLHVEILTGLIPLRAYWSSGAMQWFTPPYPATFLNDERWTDEVPQSSHVSHAHFVPESSTSATGNTARMPDSVRALIARLKAKT